MHAKPDLRVVLEWKIIRSGSVIADVRRTSSLNAIAMSTPAFEWNDDAELWECGIFPTWMPDLDCRIDTGDFNVLPTEAQHNAGYDVAGLSPEMIAELREAIELTLLDAADDNADLEDVTDPEFESAFIPKQRDSQDRFAFLFVDSDIPCDIECVALVRNGKDFRICDATAASVEYDWDDDRLRRTFDSTT